LFQGTVPVVEHLQRDVAPHVRVECVPDSCGGTRVEARLICETESQKGILIGRRGAMVKRIGSDARRQLEQMTGGQVVLDLTVRVRPRWRRDASELDRLGV
jgi:GTP-binding protein Era